jgi:hypothetical protein
MTLLQLLQGKTPLERAKILHRIVERLRVRHNNMGDQYRAGQITEEQWRLFLQVWEGRMQRVYALLNAVRDNQGWLDEASQATNRQIKTDGKVFTTYDADIDIETV